MLTPEHEPVTDRGALPLLLLPGTLCDARVFGPLLERLPGVPARVLPAPQDASMREAAEQVLADAPEQFALLGFSLGGMVALETALCAPERVQALALISTTPLPVPPDRHSARRAAVNEAQTSEMQRVVRDTLWPTYRSSGSGETMLPLLQSMAESLGRSVFERQIELALGREDFRPRLSAISCPALTVNGVEDTICPPAAVDQLAAGLSKLTSVSVPGAGHFVLLEHPDEVASAVAAWLHTAQQPGGRVQRTDAGQT